MLFFFSFLFLQNHLKDILTSVVSRRKAYRLRDGHFKYAFGSNVTPQPYLKNSVVAYNNLIERYMKFLVIFASILSFLVGILLLRIRPLLNNCLLCFCKSQVPLRTVQFYFFWCILGDN